MNMRYIHHAVILPTVAAIALAASGCATSPYSYQAPLIDHGVSTGDYNQDLHRCRYLASQRMSQQEAAQAGAGVGAVLGLLAGALAGMSGSDLARSAALGGVVGAVDGATSDTGMAQRRIVAECMTRRGWTVLDW